MNIGIIGSNRGIGLEFVKQLCAENKVFAFCRNASDQLRALDHVKVIENCDIADMNSIKDACKSLGDEKLDQLIVVSGIMADENLKNWNDDTIMKQFNVNALGVLNCARSFVPNMAADSKIGLMTSRMGSIADNTSGGRYGYRMSKAALNAGGRSLAHDLKDQGIAVFLLHPGFVKTDMTNNNGNIETDESVKGLLKVLNSKTLQETGSFWHTNGEKLPW